MKLGVVGLPNVGKSTLFNAITKAGAEAANYPFCTIEPNTGVVAVPDERLDELSAMYHPKKTTPAVIEFVDIAGLVKGASHGEGLGNKFLSHIRECEAIVHVVRCFEDPDIIRHAGETVLVLAEVVFLDVAGVDHRLGGQQEPLAGNLALLVRHRAGARGLEIIQMRQQLFAQRGLIGKALFAALEHLRRALGALGDRLAVGGDQFEVDRLDVVLRVQAVRVADVKAIAAGENAKVLVISAKIEEDIAQMDDEEKDMFLEEMGIGKSGLDRLIAECYDLLGLISFLTAGPDECRAWTIRKGTKAPQAAGKIHSDFERGFIRAEIVSFDDLKANGSMTACKEKGLVRSEGKDYVMQDGDVTLFRFNV